MGKVSSVDLVGKTTLKTFQGFSSEYSEQISRAWVSSSGKREPQLLMSASYHQC